MNQKNNRAPHPHSTQKNPEAEAKPSAYQDFLSDVRPLARADRDCVPPPQARPKHSIALPPSSPEPQLLMDIEPHPDSTIHGDSVLSHCPPSLPHTVWRRFKRHMPAQAVCDLHGLTVAEAALRSETFVLQAHEAGLRVVRLISGRGGPEARLKKALAEWLPQWPMVLAWHTAKSQDGGLGAVDLLLRAPRD